MPKRLYFFLLFAFVMLNIGLGRWGLTESSEARYAEIGREMFVNSDYINPTLLNIYHYHKPPLTYWVTAMGYNIFGLNEWGARFFLQVAIVLQLLLVYKITQIIFSDRKVSIIASLVYFSFPLVLISSRNLTTDAYLTTLIMAAVYFWLARSEKVHKVWAIYAFYLFLALAILTKGPVALLFVLVFIVVRQWALKKKVETSIHGILGLLLFLGISISWFLLLLLKNPIFLSYFLNHQLSDRMFSNTFNQSKPFYYFIIFLPILLFPWVALIFAGNRQRVKDFFKTKNETFVLIVSTGLLVLIFSLFNTKLILYILPVFWMLAPVIAKKLFSVSPAWLKGINLSYALFCVLLFLATGFLYFIGIPSVTISIGHLLSALVAVLAWFVAFKKIKSTTPLKTGVLAVGFSVVLLVFGLFFMKDNDSQINSIKNISSFIEKVSPSPEKSVLVYNYLLNSAPFYINGNIVTIYAGHDTALRDTQFQKDDLWEKNFINLEASPQNPYLLYLAKEPKCILIYRKKDLVDLKLKMLLPYFLKRREFEKWVVCYN